jgi:hypothetical protein
MRTKAYITLLVLLVAAACGNDDDGTLAPSYLDKDWLAITDSADPLDHARYEVYRDKGVSIYYTDTLGKEFRHVNAYGDSIIHVEKLDPFYSVTGEDASTTYLLSKNRDDIYNAVLFVKENVLPAIPPACYPRNILLVNELTLNAFNTEAQGRRFGNVYNGYRTLIVSNVGRVGGMIPVEKKQLMEEVTATVLYENSRSRFLVDLELFFAVSESLYTPEGNRYSVYNQMISSGTDNYKPHWYQYGFLNSSPSNPGNLAPNYSVPGEYLRYNTPTRDEDARDFFAAVLHYTGEEFDAEYSAVAGYELLRQKYDMIRNIVDDITH